MSDRMSLIPFSELINWVLEEKKQFGTVFGLQHPYKKTGEKQLSIFGEKLETPFGPAAGPHTQLAQNIIASYYAGSRFFELKTVQILDGEDLPVSKPCILAEDECYNCEWSTELRVPDAFEEYVKAWFVLKILAKELDLGKEDAFIFNMSVGYDYEGICSPKIDTFIEGLKDASKTPIWKECQEVLIANLGRFQKIDKSYIENISAKVCTSVTLSTLHGCPPKEIEKIASYLMKEKGLHTFVKCNPTLLGYKFARETMDNMGYDYVAFGDFHFKDDLQYEDAIPMFNRLLDKAKENNLEFGVKITNTFPVDVKNKELPSEEMYMSGRPLFALSISLASRLSKEFQGKLKISYSGGADFFNIAQIFQTGIWPITMATTMLKPGGYQRLTQIAQTLENCEFKEFDAIDVDALDKLAKGALTDPHHTKSIKPNPPRKMEQKVPLSHCFVAPCQEGCPIHQDIPAYIALNGEGKYLAALKVIVDKNPLPFMTGTICNHRCMSKCTRNFYEESVQIRSAKLEAAEEAFSDLMMELKTPQKTHKTKVAIIGGGPAGLSAAYFLGKSGVPVTIFEKRESLGGIVKHVIPDFRITSGAIENDIELVRKMGVEFKLGVEITSAEELKRQGFDTILFATGAWKPGTLKLEGDQSKVLDVLEFLECFKKSPQELNMGKHVVVIGGGNTAMDAARAAKRVEGVESVSLVYRRTSKYMPADEEELLLALEDEIAFKELLAPVSLCNGKLTCHKVVLGEADASGRRSPIETEELVCVDADTVIYAVGEKIDSELFQANGIEMNASGKVLVNKDTFQTNVPNVFVAGDALRGPATVVEAIADATQFAKMIVAKEEDFGKCLLNGFHNEESIIRSKRGILATSSSEKESKRCLECSTICECCVDVCPNRANVAIAVENDPMNQIIHVDGMCNECGNCAVFCPYDSRPYKDKLTLFWSESDFQDSTNQGFVVLDRVSQNGKIRIGETVTELSFKEGHPLLTKELQKLILTVLENYTHLLG